MKDHLSTAARRSAVALVMIGMVACDATRSVESPAGAAAAKPAPESSAPGYAATGVGGSIPGVATVPLVNPSFESGYHVGWSNPGRDGEFVDIGVLWTTSDGSTTSKSVDLNGFDPGYVEQSFATIPGVLYTVSFDMAGNPGAPQGTKTMVVSVAGISLNYSFSTLGKSGVNMGWTREMFSFVANGTTSTLRFQSTYVGSGLHPDKAQGAAIDNVLITWVPVPTVTKVTFGDGPFFFTGGARTATAEVLPIGAGSATITYSGDCVNVGGHCFATATFAAIGMYASSTATADIVIEKRTSHTTVSFGPGPFVYTGSAFTATASSDAGTPTIAYSGDCTNAGNTCTATATFDGNSDYSGSSATATITIDKAPTSTTAAFPAGPFVYTGSAVTAHASVSPAAAGLATISYSGDCINAGNTCSATASFAGSSNYLPSSGSAGAITIDKATTSTSVSFGAGPFIYNGSTFTATASVSSAGAGIATIAYAGECKFAGTCTATATFAGTGNFVGSSATASITIKYPVASTGEQCKNGGWQYLTDDLGNRFKNQGDCVSFVATKGKNKGAG
jgi:hypothetical protein